MSRVVELFGVPTAVPDRTEWPRVASSQRCPFLNRKCIKVRKSKPEVSIGTCTVAHGSDRAPIVICPCRLLERRQVFVDALHLFTMHEPGNELHVVREVAIPGGSVDYFLVSARSGKVVDFVGIEIQTLDTTGTIWPERQKFLNSVGVSVERAVLKSDKAFGINWKMTTKTILVQLHHKVETFEHLSKRLVLVVQDRLLAYMGREFKLGHFHEPARLGDAAQMHVYSLQGVATGWKLQLDRRLSTDAAGIATAIGLHAEAKIEMQVIVDALQQKISDQTRWNPV